MPTPPAGEGPSGGRNTAELHNALAADPMDHDGWIALARAEAEAGRSEAAESALAEARRRFRAGPFVLEKLAATERDLGLDLLEAPAPGPGAEDIAAAASMTEEDRAAMIEGMVAGLAARLKGTPDDSEGWIMRIKSYWTVGDEAKMADALERANEFYRGRSELELTLSYI